MELALASVRKVMRDDGHRLAETLAGRRKGGDARVREQRIAQLLDDPKKLRELREQRADRRWRAERWQRSEWHQSRGMSM